MEYNVSTLTRTQLCELIREGDPEHASELRIKEDGTIFLSKTDTGLQNLHGIAARTETFQPHNSYVGPDAVGNETIVNGIFEVIKKWNKDPTEKLLYIGPLNQAG